MQGNLDVTPLNMNIMEIELLTTGMYGSGEALSQPWKPCLLDMEHSLNMDCMGYISNLAGNSLDLAIVAPLYGIGMDGSPGGDNCCTVTPYKKKDMG